MLLPYGICAGPGCHITMAGNPSAAVQMAKHPQECSEDKSEAAVRCCDDSGKGFSKVPDCNSGKTYAEAAQICKDDGKRSRPMTPRLRLPIPRPNRGLCSDCIMMLLSTQLMDGIRVDLDLD